MNKIFYVIITLLSCSQLFAQKHEVGIFLGGANLISDIGRTEYIDPFPKAIGDSYVIPVAVGLIYRLNYNPQHTLRFSLGYYRVGDSEHTVPVDYRKVRDLDFKNSILEAAALFEYNFFPINSEQQNAFSPYIFGGVAGFYTNTPEVNVYHQLPKNQPGTTTTQGFESHVEYKTDSKKTTGFSIPFGLGLKYKFSWNWVISGEFGFRPTFKDDLDLGTPKESNFNFYVEENLLNHYSEEEVIKRNQEIINNTNIGNPSTNDWYVFSGLTLTYTFGRPPCFCD